jgi:class 3 adenylate cyclase
MDVAKQGHTRLDDLNLTARLLDHVKPDKVLVSEAAKELTGGRLNTVRFHTAKSFKIRGLARKVTAYPAEKAGREVDAAAAP